MRTFYLLLGLLLILGGCGYQGSQLNTDYSATGQDSRVRFVVVHYTSSGLSQSLKTLTQGEVSSHYLIDTGGEVYQLVDENRRAWHAGDSEWQGRTWLNATSIGIELVNPGYTDGPDGRRWYAFDDAQIQQLTVLLKDILQRHGLGPEAVVGHSDIAPQRKVDPGPLFPWRTLALQGVALWPQADEVARWMQQLAGQTPKVLWFQQHLAQFGYRVPRHGRLDTETRNVIAAFQMRFRPRDYSGEPDLETAALLAALNAAR